MRTLLTLLLVAAALSGCKRNSAPPAAKVAAAAPQPGGTVRGRILERLDAPPYTYLRLQIGAGEQWAAVPQNAIPAGQEVTLVNPMEMTNFESKTLKRSFPSILFASLPGEDGAAPSSGSPAPPHGPAGKGPDLGDVHTPKAGGAEGRTIAEAFAQRAALQEKTVAIRGKVVKYNAEILGRNWIHLRDGSGSPDKADHDLTVTTKDSAAIGDVVTARGVLRLNKDFGSGYSYPLILEDAKLQK